MKTILLVDDEFPARNLLKTMLDWDAVGFAVAWEAKNGTEALALYRRHKPDLIISDIQMPVMDGLELLSAIREEDSNQLFIILSCFERFDYARQVIRLGALDYLIKDTLTADVLYTVLQNAADALDGRGEAPPKLPLGQKAAPCPISVALQAWVENGSPELAAGLIRQALGGGISRYIMVSIGLEPEGDPEAFLEALEGLPGFCQSCGCCWAADGQLLVFAALPALASDEERKARHRLLKGWKSLLEAQSGVPATMGVSAGHNSLDELEAARCESQAALQYRMFMHTGHILYYSSVKNTGHTAQYRQMENRIKSLRQALVQNDGQKVDFELDRLYRQDLYGVVHLNYLENLNAILWGLLTEESMLRGIDGSAPPPERKTLDSICAMDSVQAMRDAFSARFALLMKAGRRQPEAHYSQRVRHILQYVQENLDKDISLESLAQEFQLHKTHLARVFKEEMGYGLGEYIRRQRIEKAKILLMDSQTRVNEIVYQVGFNSPQNFYTLFMRYVGLTPSDYRDKHG